MLRLLDRLAAHRYGVPVRELAEELGVTARQLRRDFAAIEEAGHAVELVDLGGERAAKLAAARGGGVKLTLRERYALLAVRSAFDVLEDTPFHEDVRNICEKVQASLPAEQQRELEGFGSRLAYLPDGGTKLYSGKEDVIDALFTGVIRRARVRYRYRGNARETRQGQLEPYAIVLYRQGLYVIGRSLTGAAEPAPERTYAIERFTSAEYLRGTTFEVPASFQIKDYFQGAFGIFRGRAPIKVVLEFVASARELVEARRWHPSQKLRRLRDGGLRVELEVSDLTQIAQWVIGWGPLARVLEPAELVARVVREHREALSLYASTA